MAQGHNSSSSMQQSRPSCGGSGFGQRGGSRGGHPSFSPWASQKTDGHSVDGFLETCGDFSSLTREPPDPSNGQKSTLSITSRDVLLRETHIDPHFQWNPFSSTAKSKGKKVLCDETLPLSQKKDPLLFHRIPTS